MWQYTHKAYLSTARHAQRQQPFVAAINRPISPILCEANVVCTISPHNGHLDHSITMTVIHALEIH